MKGITSLLNIDCGSYGDLKVFLKLFRPFHWLSTIVQPPWSLSEATPRPLMLLHQDPDDDGQLFLAIDQANHINFSLCTQGEVVL